jgi:hypothetical protein
MLEVNSLVLVLLMVLIFLIIIFIIVLSVIGFKFLKKNNELQKGDPKTQKIKGLGKSNDLLKALRSKKTQGDLFCIDHPKTHSSGICAISGEYYCEECLIKQDDIKLAKKYADIYLDNKWVQVFMFPNTGIAPESIDTIVETKKQLWQKQSVPLIVQGHYKINVDTDDIEAFTVVMSREEDFENIKEKLSFLKEEIS